MKRTYLKIATFLIPAVILSASAIGAPYTGVGPGQSTIGTGGDYASLHDACEAISSTPLTGGPWEFLILNDLEEPVDSTITQASSEGHEITIRPAPGTTPTVRFTRTQTPLWHSWYFFNAHFTVGARPDRSGRAEYIPTHRITIDGSNIPGGNSRDLNFENVAGEEARTLIRVLGGCETVLVKNVNLTCYGVREIASYVGSGVEFWSKPPGPWGPPSAIISGGVVNCKMIYHGAQKARGINLDNSDLSWGRQDVATAFTASNNEIIGFFSGIVASEFKELNIAGNVIHFNPQIDNSWHSFGLGVRCSWASASTATIERNLIRFDHSDSATGITGLSVLGGRNNRILLNNNIITGDFSGSGNRFGLRCDGLGPGSTVAIFHNSIHLGGTDGNFDSAVLSIQEYTYESGHAGTFLLQNNILHAAMPRSYVLQTSSVLNLDSDYNNLVVGEQSRVALYDNTVIEDLAAWQTQGMDANSISLNPFEPAAPSLGTWAGNPGNSSLLFTSFPGPDYLAPALDDVQVDINGTPRPGPEVLMGAHEIAADDTYVEDWRLY